MAKLSTTALTSYLMDESARYSNWHCLVCATELALLVERRRTGVDSSISVVSDTIHEKGQDLCIYDRPTVRSQPVAQRRVCRKYMSQVWYSSVREAEHPVLYLQGLLVSSSSPLGTSQLQNNYNVRYKKGREASSVGETFPSSK